MHESPGEYPRFWAAFAAVFLLVLSEALLPGRFPDRRRNIFRFASELCLAFGILVGTWHYGLYQHMDPDLSVALSVFSSWGMLRTGQWGIAGVSHFISFLLRLASVLGGKP